MENSIENGKKKQVIKSYRDLVVYQKLYKLMVTVIKEIIPKLPKEEKYDLADQLRRCCKASPALIAEGFAKRYQAKNWKKYLDDAIGECNEMIHHLSVCVDIYGNYVDKQACQHAIDEYDLINRQIYRLRESWINFHEQHN